MVGEDDIDEIEDKVTDSNTLAALNGVDKDILLCKEANKEQLEIAQRIQRNRVVLVQGPPGTGKTHTIGNLTGHFLAQGKSVLITSHTRKALKVVKDKIPKDLQSLCVSILDDTNKDMEYSIDGITEISAKNDSGTLLRYAEQVRFERNSIIDELDELREKILMIKFKEYRPIVIVGEEYSTSDAAKYVYCQRRE